MSTQSEVVLTRSGVIITRRGEIIARSGDNGPKKETRVYAMSPKRSKPLP